MQSVARISIRIQPGWTGIAGWLVFCFIGKHATVHKINIIMM